MNDLERAKANLTGVSTLSLVCGTKSISSSERGVRPLLFLLYTGTDVRGWSAADRVVGRGAAFLYAILGVKAVYAEVLSAPAEEVLLGHGIAVFAQTRVENVLNHEKDGLCPMERATLGITDKGAALAAIEETLERLRKG